MLRGFLQRMFVGPWTSTILADGAFSTPSVNATNAIRYTPVYRAVTLISNDIARISLEVSDTGADSLLASPSPYMSAFEFRRSMTMQVLLYGNAFAAINRSVGGELLELILLQPDTVSLDLTTGVPLYRTQHYGILTASQMFHLRAPSTSGLWGDSPINICRNSIQLLAAQEEMALRTYINAGNPKIALVHPGKISNEAMQRIEADYVKTRMASIQAEAKGLATDSERLKKLNEELQDIGATAKQLNELRVARLNEADAQEIDLAVDAMKLDPANSKLAKALGLASVSSRLPPGNTKAPPKSLESACRLRSKTSKPDEPSRNIKTVAASRGGVSMILEEISMAL